MVGVMAFDLDEVRHATRSTITSVVLSRAGPGAIVLAVPPLPSDASATWRR